MSKDIGVDLGTSNIRLFIKGRGIVLDEPCVVAINKITNEVLSVGSQAKEMIGRTPENIVAIKPLRDGVIADFESTRLLLDSFISRVVNKSLFYKPRLVISIPFGITDVEERAVEGVGYKIGAKEVYLVEEAMAASIGAKIIIEKPEGSMVVDIGGGTTDMAVLSMGGIVVSNSIKLAGENFDKEIVEFVKNKYNVVISESDAEEVKKQIGTVKTIMNDEKLTLKGRNISSGLPVNVVVTSSDISNAILPTINNIIKVIKSTLEETPPEISADIMDFGIILSGGSSFLKNLDRYISDELNIPVHIADSASDNVIRGIGATLDNIKVLKKAVKTKRR
ncbi:MAG: rod shape-determining protein [Clostridia bacterium]